MNILGHIAVGLIGYAASKDPLFLLGSILPDAPLIANEMRRTPFNKWDVKGKRLYDVTHSLYAPIALFFISPITSLAFLIHILLDVPFHSSSFRWKPFLFSRYKPTKKALLLSGGADSVACFMTEKDFDCYYFNYGQEYHTAEFQCAKRICDKYGKKLNVINCQWGHDAKNRNFMLISTLTQLGYDEVIIGTRNLLPFFDKYKDSNWFSLKMYQYLLRVYINTPLIGLFKKQISDKCQGERFYSSENYTQKNELPSN